jgi:hypothetical protein
VKNLSLSLFIGAAFILSSCNKDEVDPASQIDYSITSTKGFELISQHPNGWIKEGRYHDIQDHTTKEFEYYENGYIKSAKIYSNNSPYHLYMEVSRSEDNKPLWSKYYNEAGELWFETEYTDGLISVKKVYDEDGTAIHNFINGEPTTIEYTSTDSSSKTTVTYNKAQAKRTVLVTINGETILDETYPYNEQPGAGLYSHTEVPVANPFGGLETTYYPIGQSFFSSVSWNNASDPQFIDELFPYRSLEKVYSRGSVYDTKYAVSTDMYRSIIEQYPVTENGVLIGGGSNLNGYETLKSSFTMRQALAEEHNENPELYELKYGNQFADKVYKGKTYLVIGAIRNVPKDIAAYNQIKEVARKHLNSLLNANSDGTTETEQQLLHKVWFEVKFFSTLKEQQNGVLIESYQDYQNAFDAIDQAENSTVQIKYGSVENL